MSRFSVYLTTCVSCGKTTSKKYAREHNGLCKFCATGKCDESLLCPDCREHYLTRYQKAHHYHCDWCTRMADPEGYAREVRGLNDY